MDKSSGFDITNQTNSGYWKVSKLMVWPLVHSVLRVTVLCISTRNACVYRLCKSERYKKRGRFFKNSALQ